MDLDANRRSTALVEMAGRGLSRWPSVKKATRVWSWWQRETTDSYSTRVRSLNSQKAMQKTLLYWKWRTVTRCCVWTSVAVRRSWRSMDVIGTELWGRTSWVMDIGTVWTYSRLARYCLPATYIVLVMYIEIHVMQKYPVVEIPKTVTCCLRVAVPSCPTVMQHWQMIDPTIQLHSLQSSPKRHCCHLPYFHVTFVFVTYITCMAVYHMLF